MRKVLSRAAWSSVPLTASLPPNLGPLITSSSSRVGHLGFLFSLPNPPCKASTLNPMTAPPHKAMGVGESHLPPQEGARTIRGSSGHGLPAHSPISLFLCSSLLLNHAHLALSRLPNHCTNTPLTPPISHKPTSLDLIFSHPGPQDVVFLPQSKLALLQPLTLSPPLLQGTSLHQPAPFLYPALELWALILRHLTACIPFSVQSSSR